jgi:hypothetical protein
MTAYGTSNQMNLTVATPDEPGKPYGTPVNLKGTRLLMTGSETTSNFVSKRMKSKASARLAQALSLAVKGEFNTSTRFQCTGSQNTQLITDLAETSGTTGPQNTYGHSLAIFTGNYASTNLGSGSLLALANVLQIGGAGTGVFYVENCSVRYAITNATTQNLEIDLYELCAKHDYGSFLYTATPGAGPFASEPQLIWSPYQYWAYGDAQATSTTNAPGLNQAVINPKVMNTPPTDSRFFNEYWKIESKITLLISSGSTHVRTSLYEANKVISYQRYYNTPILQGMTRTIMIVAKGQPQLSSSVIVESIPVLYITADMTYRGRTFPNTQTYTETVTTI